jgi:hypothetical protein
VIPTRDLQSLQDELEVDKEPGNKVVGITGGRDHRKERSFAHQDHIMSVAGVNDIGRTCVSALMFMSVNRKQVRPYRRSTNASPLLDHENPN